MKFIFCVLLSIACVKVTYAQTVKQTAYHHCFANGKQYILQGKTSCETAACMFKNFFANSRIAYNPSDVKCEEKEFDFYTVTFIVNPSCPIVPAHNATVTVYEHRNYKGYSLTYKEGDQVSHMKDLCTSPWCRIFNPCDPCNDDLSSFKVSPGLMIITYEHENFGGQQRFYTSDTPYVGDDWHDKISSFKIVSVK